MQHVQFPKENHATGTGTETNGSTLLNTFHAPAVSGTFSTRSIMICYHDGVFKYAMHGTHPLQPS